LLSSWREFSICAGSLSGNIATVALIGAEENCRHASASELALNAVVSGEYSGARVDRGLDAVRLSHGRHFMP